MIFVAVGTQLPFDRLVRAVDEWAAGQPHRRVVAQVGPSSYRAVNIEALPFVEPAQFRRYAQAADFIVCHAGMGTIITALELGKRVIAMPRRADLREHRNDHQMATAKRLLTQKNVAVAFTVPELVTQIDRMSEAGAPARISAYASGPLIDALSAFLAGARPVAGAP